MANTRGEVTIGLLPSAGLSPVEWRVSNGLIGYDHALSAMTARAAAIARGEAAELVWLLEHPALYTAGTSARPEELIEARFPVHTVGRGGQFTYHGPGQRVGYVMLDLRRRGGDVRLFVGQVEDWVIRSLAGLGVEARRSPGKIGVWVNDESGREAKIGAIGIRVRRWVSFHGFALNVDPDLSHFAGIVPCGLAGSEVTSLRKLGLSARMPEVDAALKASFPQIFPAAASLALRN
jgi:lipoyl(octanoyl) transferase